MAAMASQMRNVCAMTGGALGGIALPSRNVRTARMPAQLVPGRVVRCEALPEEKYVNPIDQATKKTITREEVLQNQATNESEQRSIFGEKPPAGSPYGRPEVERRPETGNLSPWSVFAFDGAAPETINGRLAMLGFVWAIIGEKTTGLSVADQLFSPGATGLIWFLASVQILSYASLVPIFNARESTDARSFGPFRAKAERWNGRAAMIGFASLILTEAIIQGPLFVWFFNNARFPV
uniref:ELIP1 n=1 Tax=Syntrichia caninervis TaxID=200751 RepID=A0A0F7LCR8_9BRYO|nr:ELIP1 [Syntrichia caninervis]